MWAPILSELFSSLFLYFIFSHCCASASCASPKRCRAAYSASPLLCAGRWAYNTRAGDVFLFIFFNPSFPSPLAKVFLREKRDSTSVERKREKEPFLVWFTKQRGTYTFPLLFCESPRGVRRVLRKTVNSSRGKKNNVQQLRVCNRFKSPVYHFDHQHFLASTCLSRSIQGKPERVHRSLCST